MPAANSVFILFGLRWVWEVRRILVALLTVDRDAIPIPQTKQTRGTLGARLFKSSNERKLLDPNDEEKRIILLRNHDK